MKNILQTELWGIISPAPELAHQAVQAKTAIVELESNHIVAQQFEKLVPVFQIT